MTVYYTLQSQFDWFFAEGGQSTNKMHWNNNKTSYSVFWSIIYVDILLNVRILPRPCMALGKNIMQLVKHPHILSTKTPNKAYLFTLFQCILMYKRDIKYLNSTCLK